jgi:peptidyl-prolyl cis-trans isomerase B (cyclophilin B)
MTYMNMKRLPLGGVAILCALSLLCGCGQDEPAPESSEVSTSSTASSQPALTQPTYTMEEAASKNASITDDDVQLIQFEAPAVGTQIAVIHTNLGDLEMILFPKEAPRAVENFVTHAEEGYYNGLTFDKVLANFIIEGGDLDGKGGESIFIGADGKPEAFEGEYSLNLWHFRGAVSMSLPTGAAGNGSRFFIVQAPFVDSDTLELMGSAMYPGKVLDKYEEIGGVPGFDHKRTVFAMLTEESLMTLDTIAATEVEGDGTPLETVLIESIEMRTVEQPTDDGEGE